MNRKDTILVAVLINAGLLIVLFATATKPGDVNMATKVDEANTFTSVEVPVHSETKPEVSLDLSQASAKIESEVRFEPREIEIIGTPENGNSHETSLAAPVEAPQESIQTQPQFNQHIVEKGQVLEKIAKMHHTQVEAIMTANQLTTSQLKIGQVLKIPTAKAVKTATTTLPEKNSGDTSQAKYYIVKPGDSPWTIAVKNKIKVEDLLRLNQLDQAKAKKLKPGDKLRIQ